MCLRKSPQPDKKLYLLGPGSWVAVPEVLHSAHCCLVLLQKSCLGKLGMVFAHITLVFVFLPSHSLVTISVHQTLQTSKISLYSAGLSLAFSSTTLILCQSLCHRHALTTIGVLQHGFSPHCAVISTLIYEKDTALQTQLVAETGVILIKRFGVMVLQCWRYCCSHHWLAGVESSLAFLTTSYMALILKLISWTCTHYGGHGWALC